jgi:TonB-dependent SusC/RagA subfamily outer membrane receptor
MKKNLLSKILFSLVCLVSMSWSAMAQSQTITGKVTDEKGEALVGVNIILKETSRGTSTNIDGKYTISVPGASSQLTFTSVGYDSKTITVGSQTLINVVLAANAQNLSEVVVIGYGTQRKSDLTGAVSSIKTEQLLERPASSLNQALAGRMAGVQVNNNSGRPGGRTTVRVRGFSSINSSNNPLYVVDGVPISNINTINPNDIESVNVLKDPSTTAIYGVRGANGVVLIKTKTGGTTTLKIPDEILHQKPLPYTLWVYGKKAKEFKKGGVGEKIQELLK